MKSELNPTIKRLFYIVSSNKTHKHYAHTVKKAQLYKQLVGGLNLDDLLRQFVRREDDELFQQRKTLTHHIVTSITKNLLDIFYKIPRSNSGRSVLTYKGDKPEARVAKIQAILNKFWGTKSWKDYMGTRFIELNATDPNSFVVFEWPAFDGLKSNIQPRPYEVSSSAAVDYRYENNVLQYLTVKDSHWYAVEQDGAQMAAADSKAKLDPTHGKKKGSKYTLYGKDQTWQLLQIEEPKLASGPTSEEGVIYKAGIGKGKIQFVKLGENYYQYKELNPHKIGQVMAFQVGYYRDLATNGETFVYPLHAVEPFLLKSIKTNSELDLVATLLALPQQVSLAPPCKDIKCLNGYLEDGTTKCGTCKGSGMQPTAPSSQDAIRIKIPKNPDQHIALSEFIKYVHPPVDIVQWQENYIEKLMAKCKEIMFNSDTFSRKQIADTATGRTLDMQNVYDTLHPFAMKFAETWVFGVKVQAQLADMHKELIVAYTFGRDFKLKTLDSLISDLAAANTIGNPNLVQHINSDIAHIIFAEKPIQMQRYELKELYNPFRGKSEKEILILMATSFVTMRQKVLHANYGTIFDELELEHKDFYTKKRTDQRKLIYGKVDDIIAALKAENPDPELPLGE